ncbi:MAG TPA: ribosome-associated translation inhibitor RaiA [Bdellovibrionota bacterium]|nr:ribosome-associated translation inhibitor RaiA [Bdellovibrionota bacterium]
MKSMITFRHMAASPAVKEFVTERLEKLDRFGNKGKEAHVILETEKYMHHAEVVLSSKNFKARGKASTGDMYASIEEAITKVEKSLRKHHDKSVKAKNHAGRAAEAA